MFGVKINQFDNSDGTIEVFNKIFPKTPLENSSAVYVEIGDIVLKDRIFQSNLFLRKLELYDKEWNKINELEYDFGEKNFYDNEDFIASNYVRFKYYARDLDGNIIARGYSFEELAKKMNCGVEFVKNIFVYNLENLNNKKYSFTVTRIEL